MATISRKDIKNIASLIASQMHDTEKEDLYVIHDGLIGFTCIDAPKVIEKYINSACDELMDWEVTLKGCTPVYFSQSERIAHTAADMLEREDALAAIETQEYQKSKDWFMPMYELISRQGNTSSKCHRMAEHLEFYFTKFNNKQVTTGILKLTIDMLKKASSEIQENIETIREKCEYMSEMNLSFNDHKMSILKSDLRHIVPNIENFFSMRKHIQIKYFSPLNWHFRRYEKELQGIHHEQYQTIKQQKELKLAFESSNTIVAKIRQAYEIFKGDTETPI